MISSRPALEIEVAISADRNGLTGEDNDAIRTAAHRNEYTTQNVNEFLVDIGFLESQPEVALPHKEISAGRSDIQNAKYSGKKDWDEIPKYRRYREENNIDLIPFGHYEMETKHPSKPLAGRLARQDKNSDGKLQADEIPARVRDEIWTGFSSEVNSSMATS